MQRMSGRRPAPSRPRIVWAVAAAMVASVAIASPALATSAGPAAKTAPPVRVELQSRQVYTGTGITLRAGDSVSITASGKIHFGGGEIKSMSPSGIPRGDKCTKIASKQPGATSWPAPKANCWSLIAKVGAATPVEVGSATSFRAQQGGALLLGLNDNFRQDNTGQWLATISVTRASTTPSPGSSPGATKKSSTTLLFVLVGVAVLVALFVLLWARQRAQKKRRAVASGMAAAPDDLALVGAAAVAADSAPEPVAALAPWSAPPETDSIDVNIFEVEFSNGLTLRIGYNHFPEGTELRWRVTQNRLTAAAGSFVAKGGGSTNHVETIPLGVKLDGRQTQPDGADVQFDWSINGVPFRYSVRRDPNC